MDFEQKNELLKLQIESGIKNIEIGFIAVGEEEKNDIKRLLDYNNQANLFCLARLLKTDIDDCISLGCKNVTIFVPSSDELIQLKLKKTVNDIEKMIEDVVKYAVSCNLSVRFSCEDATRTPIDRLIKFYKIAEYFGSHTISVPDTCGISIPSGTSRLIDTLRKNIRCSISMHCHNDLGLATANTLAGFEAGADEVQATINGVGERIGNCDIFEILVLLRKYYNKDSDINFYKLRDLYELFLKFIDIPMRSDKPILGRNQFLHESGLHVRAISQGKGYQAFPPEWIGSKHDILYGGLSGMANIEYLCNKYNIRIDVSLQNVLLNNLKVISNIKKRYLSEVEVINLLGELKNKTIRNVE